MNSTSAGLLGFGSVFVLYGLWLIWHPAAFLFAGLVFIGAAVLTLDVPDKKPKRRGGGQ